MVITCTFLFWWRWYSEDDDDGMMIGRENCSNKGRGRSVPCLVLFDTLLPLHHSFSKQWRTSWFCILVVRLSGLKTHIPKISFRIPTRLYMSWCILVNFMSRVQGEQINGGFTVVTLKDISVSSNLFYNKESRINRSKEQMDAIHCRFQLFSISTFGNWQWVIQWIY